MFLKMFKYSFKETIKIVTVLSVALVVAYALLGGGYALIVRGVTGNAFTGVLTYTGTSVLGVTAMVVSIVPTVFTIYLLIGTHRDFTSDRAYFTFTIPIKPKDLILSKALSIFLQFLILSVAQIIGVTIAGVIIAVSMKIPLAELIKGVFEILQATGSIISSSNGFWDVISIIELFLIILLAHALMILLTVLIAVLALNDKKKLFIILAVIFVGGYVLSIVLVMVLAYLLEVVFSVGELTTLTYQIVLITVIVVLLGANFGVYKWAETKIKKGVNLK